MALIKYSQLLLIILALTSCKEKKAPPAAANSSGRALMVEGFIVRPTVLNETISVPGTLRAFETTEIRPEVTGRVVSISFTEGRYVEKGTLLVTLFNDDLKARLNKLKVQLSKAETTAKRYSELLKISGISQQEFDLAELEVHNLNADIQLVNVDIARTEIRAPYSGQLGLRNVSLGAYVTPNDVITNISQVNKLKIDFTVPEKYTDRMMRGKKIDFTIDGSDKHFSASIIATESHITEETRSLKVLGEVARTDNTLVPGAFANVSVEMGSSGESLIIPTQAVIPEARHKKVLKYSNGKHEAAIVTTGIRDSSYIQVLDGLSAGDTVIITGLLAIRPGTTVSLSKIN